MIGYTSNNSLNERDCFNPFKITAKHDDGGQGIISMVPFRGYNGISASIVKSFDGYYPTIMPHHKYLKIQINIKCDLVLCIRINYGAMHRKEV